MTPDFNTPDLEARAPDGNAAGVPLSAQDPLALLPIAASGLVELSAEEVGRRLERFSRAYKLAMAPATVRAVRGDWDVYARWCRAVGCPELKWISPDLRGMERDDAEDRALRELEAFFRDQIARGLRRSTLDRYHYTIGLAHRAARIPDITDLPAWHVIWKGIGKTLRLGGRNRKRPAAPLRQQTIEEVVMAIEADAPTLREFRDTALLCLASDSMARREELARVTVEDFKPGKDGAFRLEIQSSKTDQEGRGLFRHVSAATMAHIQRWLAAADISSGPVFRAISAPVRRITTHDAPSTKSRQSIRAPKPPRISQIALQPQEVARIFQRRLKAAGIDTHRISGHSTRVGSTHDLLSEGYTAAQIAQVAGWASDAMPSYYGRELATDDSAMADARAKRPMPAPALALPPKSES